MESVLHGSQHREAGASWIREIGERGRNRFHFQRRTLANKHRHDKYNNTAPTRSAALAPKTGFSTASLALMFRLCLAFSFLSFGVISSAFAVLGLGDSLSWKEEVLLHDGQTIVIERTHTLGSRPTIESRDRRILAEEIRFSVPATGQKIIWRMSFKDSASEPDGVNVVLIGIVGGIPYLAGYPAGCIAYEKWKRPNPPQILYKYEGIQWKRITLAEFPSQLVEANIIVGGAPQERLQPFYSVTQVHQRNRDIDTPEYKSILREPITRNKCPRYPSGPKAPNPIKPLSGQYLFPASSESFDG
jgi:hypothetical protein